MQRHVLQLPRCGYLVAIARQPAEIQMIRVAVALCCLEWLGVQALVIASVNTQYSKPSASDRHTIHRPR